MSSTPTLAHQAEPDGIGTLHRALATVKAEHAFDRLNPDFGIAADHYHHQGHHAVQQREAALALGTRATIDLQREEAGPPAWRAGEIAGRARLAALLARTRQGPERTTGPER
jgi:hypothetical protein